MGQIDCPSRSLAARECREARSAPLTTTVWSFMPTIGTKTVYFTQMGGRMKYEVEDTTRSVSYKTESVPHVRKPKRDLGYIIPSEDVYDEQNNNYHTKKRSLQYSTQGHFCGI